MKTVSFVAKCTMQLIYKGSLIMSSNSSTLSPNAKRQHMMPSCGTPVDSPRISRMGQYGNCSLLGDSAYPLQHWLIAPIPTPANDAEEQCIHQRRMHQKIENCFGRWKMRWLCIHKYGKKVIMESFSVICDTLIWDRHGVIVICNRNRL